MQQQSINRKIETTPKSKIQICYMPVHRSCPVKRVYINYLTFGGRFCVAGMYYTSAVENSFN